MDIYDKDERTDLNSDQKKVLKALAQSYKVAAVQPVRFANTGKS
jgi:hypothetical protein